MRAVQERITDSASGVDFYVVHQPEMALQLKDRKSDLEKLKMGNYFCVEMVNRDDHAPSPIHREITLRAQSPKFRSAVSTVSNESGMQTFLFGKRSAIMMLLGKSYQTARADGGQESHAPLISEDTATDLALLYDHRVKQHTPEWHH